MNSPAQFILAVAVFVAVLAPNTAWADVPSSWGIAFGLVQWWVVLLGLVVEWPFVRAITGRSWSRSILPTIVMNAISTLVGAFLLILPLALPFELLYRSGPSGVVLGYLIVIGMSIVIEATVLMGLFGWSRSLRGIALLSLANSLTVIGMFAGETPWPASLEDQRRIERTYAVEIGWMRDLLQQWPDHVRPRDGQPALETDKAFAIAVSQRARSLRFLGFGYQGPAGSFSVLAPRMSSYNWRVVRRSVRGDVEFERLEAERRGQREEKPPPRFRYRIFRDRQDGRWFVEAEFEADPGKPSDPPPSQEQPKERR